jgi:hypothetical protein
VPMIIPLGANAGQTASLMFISGSAKNLWRT